MAERAGRRRALRIAALLAASTLASAAPRAQPLVADLSDHLVAITTGFTGTDLLLFGAVEGEGDVVVVVRGPEERVEVRRKDRVLGLWLTRDRVTFEAVPAYYAIAASRDLEGIADTALLARHRIGFEHLRFIPTEARTQREIAVYRAALIRNKQRKGQFTTVPGKVRFLGGRLFRTKVFFPSNVPTGTYTVDVYLIRDGTVIAAQTTPLIVSRIGLGAEVFAFAHDYAAYYGLIAILIALVAGWTAGAVFRRV